MPNTTSRIQETQRQRLAAQKKSNKYGPSNVYLQVLGSGADGVANTVYLFTDQKRYLFNCGEGTQRIAHEHKVKLSRLEHVFITSKSWKNMGGLPGLSLTLQDVGVPNIVLHGPTGLDKLYNATKRFVVMKNMQVTMADCTDTIFEDNIMTVKYVILDAPGKSILEELSTVPKRNKPKPVEEKEFEEFVNDETDYYTGRSPISASKYLRKSPEKNAEKEGSSNYAEKILEILQKRDNPAMAYICTLKKRLGQLNLAACVEKGVPPGPLLGQLKNGKDVVLPDGTIVLSKDVKTPDDPGPVFIVLEIPNISYLNEDDFASYYDVPANKQEDIPVCIVHLSPPEVVKSAKFREFIARFGPKTEHIMVNEDNQCLGSEAVHRAQHKLHLVDEHIFPWLGDVSLPPTWELNKTTGDGDNDVKDQIAVAQFRNIVKMESYYKHSIQHSSNSSSSEQLLCETGNVLPARTLTVYHLRPTIKVDRSHEPKVHISEYIYETMSATGVRSSLEQFHSSASQLRPSTSKEYPTVMFTGTGSCIPSKARNTSGIAVMIDAQRSMILDCGEGTYGQLVRFFGPRYVKEFMRTLRMIYVSHLHADHHIGLLSLLQARKKAFEDIGCEASQVQPLYLFAPGQIFSWLNMYHQRFEPTRSLFTLIPNQHVMDDSKKRSECLTNAVLSYIGIRDLVTCLVPHCPNAFGVSVSIGDFKITYSGDTLPSENLVKIGQDSTLLIHEATMEDELEHEARKKMHSTTSQAISIGKSMNAKHIILTHFSQRYARIPRMSQEVVAANDNVGIAFDNMRVTPSDLPLLPLMFTPLQHIFAEHCAEMDQKAMNRELHRAKATKRKPDDDSNVSSTSSL